MDYVTFKQYVRRAGLEIKEFAQLVGMNHRSISNYSRNDSVPAHLAIIALMMMELVKHEVDLKAIFSRLKIDGANGLSRTADSDASQEHLYKK